LGWAASTKSWSENSIRLSPAITIRSSSTLAFWMTNTDVADRAQPVVGGGGEVVEDLDGDGRARWFW